jgi:type I restriction enzyme M protein
LEENHVQQLFDWYSAFENAENNVKVVSLGEIAENDYNLNIPLYVEKIIEDNLPSVEEALSDLKSAWEESQKAEERFKQILKEFTE